MDRARTWSALLATLMGGALLISVWSVTPARSAPATARLNATDTLVVGIECGDDFVVTLTDPQGRMAKWRLGPIENHIPGCRVQLPYEGAEEESEERQRGTEPGDEGAPADTLQMGNCVFWIPAPAVGRWRLEAAAGPWPKSYVQLSVRLGSRGVWLHQLGGSRPWATLAARQSAIGRIDVRRNGAVAVGPAVVRAARAPTSGHGP